MRKSHLRDIAGQVWTVFAMWWIKAHIKMLVLVLLVACLAGVGGLLVLRNSSSGTSTDGGTGIVVRQDENGRVIISNTNERKESIPFVLPRSCKEAGQLIEKYAKQYKTDDEATNEVRQVFSIYDSLGQSLCSFREWLGVKQNFIDVWYAPSATSDPSTTTVPAGSTIPADSTTTTVAPDNTAAPAGR